MQKKLQSLFKQFFESEIVASLLLLFCTVVSMSIANSPFGEGYANFMHNKLNLSFSIAALNHSIEQWVNDGLMAVFFLMVGLEVKREIYIGELSAFKKAILPFAAAVGGMVLPSLIHYAFNNGTPTERGFAIPMATDIAFALGILALAGNKIPTSVKIFLSALAIIDDIGAILIIAFIYTQSILFDYLLVALAILVLLLLFNFFKVKRLAFYLIPAVVMWYCFLQSGVHATLSGVLVAFTIPFGHTKENNVSLLLQRYLHKPVAYIILPIFALVNTAVILPPNFVVSLTSVNSIGIILGLFVGKVVGIVGFPLILIKTGVATLQKGITFRSLVGIGFLGGIGFTMSMFISQLAFNDSYLIVTSKLSILFGSILSAFWGLIALWSSTKNQNDLT